MQRAVGEAAAAAVALRELYDLVRSFNWFSVRFVANPSM
jgi:hypothetical protein